MRSWNFSFFEKCQLKFHHLSSTKCRVALRKSLPYMIDEHSLMHFYQLTANLRFLCESSWTKHIVPWNLKKVQFIKGNINSQFCVTSNFGSFSMSHPLVHTYVCSMHYFGIFVHIWKVCILSQLFQYILKAKAGTLLLALLKG